MEAFEELAVEFHDRRISIAAYQEFAFYKRLLPWLLLHTYKRIVSRPNLPSS